MYKTVPNNEHVLLDAVRSHLGLNNDSALAKRLMMDRSALSNIRSRKRPMPDWVLLSIHEETEWPFDKIRSLAA